MNGESSFLHSNEFYVYTNQRKRASVNKAEETGQGSIFIYQMKETMHRLVNLGRQDNLAILRKAKREGAKNSSTYLRTLKM